MKKEKKICIVTMGNLYLVPYLNTYTSKTNSPISIIYWDRAHLNETYDNSTLYRFEHNFDTKSEKARGYIAYRNFIKKTLLEQNYDVVIFLQTVSALLVNDILIKHYKGKFIVDVRDYTYENNKLIFNIEKKLFLHSAMNVVSSEGFLNFLPKNATYEIAHNIREWPKFDVVNIKNRNKNKNQLHIVFVGFVNYQEQHKKLLLALKNDPRFLISFVGTRGDELKPFCNENDINNVQLIDTFKSEDTLKFYENADFVNNLYGNNTPVLDYALSNKLYYAATLNIPILVCEQTFMEDISQKYNFGVTVNLDQPENLGDYLFNSYKNIDWVELENGCDEFIESVYQQQHKFEEKLFNLLN
ncbi:hypothetical protein [Streptococcus parauberis]|uniref:hypothetical protein n=1 Tax=Streptococcus parauberis TaxID=1348 RepID=UPI000E3AB473|nr:hypothetical protein [Streptococcus parauberis]RFE02324.1 hypothetical protein ADO06_00592 [Streptococcus parauberis]